MSLEDIYPEFPEVLTAEEKEDANYELQPGDRPSWFADIHTKAFTSLVPVAEYKAAFEKRRPALGMTRAQIEELEALSKNPRLCRPARNRLFQSLRRLMLHQLISTSGASNTGHLCAILFAELESGKPAPVPSWYEFVRSTGAPRKIGYAYCATRNCFNTEGPHAKPFPKCAKCQVAVYCGRACQVRDWGERHKIVCKAAKRGRDLLSQPIHPFALGNRALLDVADVLPEARAVVSALHPDDPQLQELRLQELNAAFNAGYLGHRQILNRRRRHGEATGQRAPPSQQALPRGGGGGAAQVRRGTANAPAASSVPGATPVAASSSHPTTGAAAYSHPANRNGASVATGATGARSTSSSSPSLVDGEQSFRPAVDLELDLEEDEDAIFALQKRVMQNMQHLQNPELLRQTMANPELIQQVMGALDVQLPDDRQLQREIVAAMALRVAAGASGAAGLSPYPAAGPDFGNHQQHGHSHGGVPCHNHGHVAADYGDHHPSHPESEHPHYAQQYHHYPHAHTHGHSHGGVPCNGHYIDDDDVDDADDMDDEIDDDEEEYLERLHFLVHRRKDLEQRLSELEIERERLQGRANKNKRQKIGKKITKLEKEFIAVEEELEDFEALDLEEAEAEAERLATRAMAALRDIASAKTS